MEKENNKKTTVDINEEMMMNLMVDGVKKEGLQLPKHAEEIENEASEHKLKPQKKERKQVKELLSRSYGDHFLRTHSMTKRGDKNIYVSREHHERLSRIIQVIGKDEISLYAYLHNILEHHFEMFEQSITDDFNENFKPLF